MVVAAIGFDFDTVRGCKLFESNLGLNGLTGSKGDLMSDEDKGRGMVDKESTTMVLMSLFLFPIRMGKAT